MKKIIVAGFGSFIGISIMAYLSLSNLITLLIPSFGASAVLLYGAAHVPMAKPRNVFFGHMLSAVIGITIYQYLGISWWSLALGVSLAIIAMMLTDTMHPPGGATALIAMINKQDYLFVLKPVALGAVLLVLVSLLMQRLHKS